MAKSYKCSPIFGETYVSSYLQHYTQYVHTFNPIFIKKKIVSSGMKHHKYLFLLSYLLHIFSYQEFTVIQKYQVFFIQETLLLNMNARYSYCLLGVGVTSFAVYFGIRYLLSKNKPPDKWKHVGVLSDLMCYPIKSCGTVRGMEMECTEIGLQSGWLKDRYFMIVNSDYKFITARMHPKLVLVQPMVVENILTLEAPGMETIEIDLKALTEGNIRKVEVWDDPIPSFDCGDKIANWFSRYIFNEENGARLICFPKSKENEQRKRKDGFIRNNDGGAFTDLTSYNIINASSVVDLNTKSKTIVTPQHFRPNFVVDGPSAFDEDNWKWVKIGDVIFKAVKNCTRCILTTINPETGEKNPDKEPLTTLKTYRIIEDNKQNSIPNKTHPVMGVNLIVRKTGVVAIGDPVMVSYL